MTSGEGPRLEAIHRTARNAVDVLLKKAKRGKHDPTEYYEVQLQHEIACLMENRNRVVHLCCPYPNSKQKTDILVDYVGKGLLVWIEVKYRKHGTWTDSGLGGLKWDSDFKKLREVRQGTWKARHSGFWVWLYFFRNYGEEIHEVFGDRPEWKRARSLKSVADFFSVHDGRKSLGSTLTEVGKACGNRGTCSIMPSLPLEGFELYSALLTTVQVK